MILIGLGGNLESRFGPPRATLAAALEAIAEKGIEVRRVSPWYETAPVPAADQPWYANGVACVGTPLSPQDLLRELQNIELQFGRIRTVPNAARILDIDLLEYDGLVLDTPELKLPHPRLHERAFVLLPLRDVAPDWRHPVSGKEIDALIMELSPGQQIRRAPAG